MTLSHKETFLFVLSALFSQMISVRKATKIMEIEPDILVELLYLMSLEFSYLMSQDVTIEKNY